MILQFYDVRIYSNGKRYKSDHETEVFVVLLTAVNDFSLSLPFYFIILTLTTSLEVEWK
jgi:hypothetical protein